MITSKARLTTEDPQFTIIYIMGRSRSGSTVLDLILSNHSMITGAGELATAFRSIRTERCSCSAAMDQCEFWGAVCDELQQLHPDTSLDSYARMIDYMGRFHRIPQIKTRWGLPGRVKHTYDAITSSLYSLINEKSGCRYIVESSKEMARACYLLSRFPTKVKVIHLIRDGRGVMWSILKSLSKVGPQEVGAGAMFDFLSRALKIKSSGAIMALAALSWNLGTLLAMLFDLYKGRVLTVRYEDLCSKPSQELARIGAFLGLDLSALAEKIEQSEPLDIGHSIGGNRMRYSPTGTFVFKPDMTWRQSLPARYKFMFLLLALPAALRYGYLR